MPIQVSRGYMLIHTIARSSQTCPCPSVNYVRCVRVNMHLYMHVGVAPHVQNTGMCLVRVADQLT
jgi:hypothetical protein